MLDVISFLTQIPIRKEVKIEEVATRSYLFPFAALLIGLLVSVVAFVCFRFLATELASLFTLLTIYLITGLMHLDGLADFFDGIMATGSRSEKRKAMKDAKIGIAGLFAVIFVQLLSLFAITIACAATFDFDLCTFYTFASVFIIAEVSAKISINTCLLLGKGFDVGEGMGALFIRSSTGTKYILALLSSLFIALICTIFTDIFRFFIAFTGIVVAFCVVWMAKKKFGAVSGDVIGASNELARCVTLLIWAILLS
ncbi:MAG TPA: adenosylcobinamide-GDP ribazoletransferase [Methanophagales archaeon]|nr:adenosylcobinamide-GDP ribazoletransferase [Methanophagales archaeon]